MIVNKVLVQKIIVSLTDLSVYVPQCGLDDRQKDDFYNSLSMLLESQGRKKFQLQQENLMFTGNNPENSEDQHGRYGYGVRKKEGKVFMSFVQL